MAMLLGPSKGPVAMRRQQSGEEDVIMGAVYLQRGDDVKQLVAQIALSQ